MAVKVRRREFLAGAAGAAAAASLPFPAIAQPKPIRVGLLTVKTGPLASGGIQMEQGTIRFFKDRDYTLAGRKVELIVADTGGNPAGTKTKTQELVERDHVDLIFGPLAAFELLAITDYAAQAKMPILSLAAAEDMTQRRPTRTSCGPRRPRRRTCIRWPTTRPRSSSSSGSSRSPTTSRSATSRWAASRACSRTPAERSSKKLWPPIVTPDYTPYLAQIGGVDAVVAGLRRLQSAEVHEAVQGPGPQAADVAAAGRHATKRS